ncbi:MAG: IS256 family transposase [bacterium]
MREMDFSESNLFNRWCGVNTIWRQLEGEVKRQVKVSLERALGEEVGRRVGCERYERSGSRRNYRNGHYERDLLSRYGWIEGLQVPRLRRGGYEHGIFERYRRRQRQLDWVLLEAFLLGHATRKTRLSFKSTFGAEVSAQTVSNLVKELDGEVRRFHHRRLRDHYRFLYLDGLWLKVRRPCYQKKVLLVALGVRADGEAELLSFQVAVQESESCWWGFVSDLQHRGLWGGSLEVIVSDGNPGLLKALQAHYPRVRRQRCTFHQATGLAKYCEQSRHRRRLVNDALAIFNAEHEKEARRRLRQFREKWSAKEPAAVRNLLKGFESCLTYLDFPEPWRTRLKTNNLIERYLEELNRRIIPMRSFNNVASIERIVYGIIAYVLNQPQEVPEHQFTQNA